MQDIISEKRGAIDEEGRQGGAVRGNAARVVAGSMTSDATSVAIAVPTSNVAETAVWLRVAAAAPSSTRAKVHSAPRTLEAFERYVAETETRMADERAGDSPFLWIDRQSASDRADADDRLSGGGVVIERLDTRDAAGKSIKIPKGMVHHWVGTVRIPDVTLETTLALVQDYERYADVYTPNVRRSALLDRDGDRFRSSLQLYMKKVVSVVLNTEYDVEFQRLGSQRAWVPNYATRIVEVADPDTPDEREKPVGNDRGFLWRLNTYCSFEQRESDTYMQWESVSLSRGIPFMLGALIKPFVTGIPRETLTFTLEAARRHLTAADRLLSPFSSP